jgi:hypothetical protein
MNFLKLIDDIQTADPEFADRISPRRSAIKNITSFGSKVAAAALPMAFGTLFKKAYGQTLDATVIDVLNFALTAEIAELGLYQNGASRSGFIPSTYATNFNLIVNDETAHVRFITNTLGTANVSATNRQYAAAPNTYFDYTAKGAFPDVLTNFDTFIAVAAGFEDNGQRAYKGQATAIMQNDLILNAALNIHSVEARHASYLRIVRKLRNPSLNAKPWPSGEGSTASGVTSPARAAEVANAIYTGESNTVQGGIDITTLGLSATTASEAFDEPSDRAKVLSVLSNFIR